jgi:hypothetical protein
MAIPQKIFIVVLIREEPPGREGEGGGRLRAKGLLF